jgi:isoquinoline 1-oxidoreductase subunit alpha
MTTFNLNGRTVLVHSPDDAPLLWVIRDEIGLTGTKFGCGIGLCAHAQYTWRGAPRDPVSPRSARWLAPR